MDDQRRVISAIRAAQLILTHYADADQRDDEQTVAALAAVLVRDDVVEAVDRLEAVAGLHFPR
jgi:ribonuclease BN (tRNA processing enzyme)